MGVVVVVVVVVGHRVVRVWEIGAVVVKFAVVVEGLHLRKSLGRQCLRRHRLGRHHLSSGAFSLMMEEV